MGKVGLIVFSGLPGSGKTTIARTLCETQESELKQLGSCQTVAKADLNSPVNFHHVCYDDLIPRELEVKIISCSVEDETFVKWKHQRAKIVRCVEWCLALISHRVEDKVDDNVTDTFQEYDHEISQFASNFQRRIDLSFRERERNDRHVFIIDDNMYYRSMRYEYFQLARKYNAGFAQVHITCPVETAQERNSRRQEGIVPDQVIKDMAGKMERPKQDVFWEKFVLFLDSPEDIPRNLKCIHKLVEEALAQPFEPLPQIDNTEGELSRIQCSSSVLHQADQILRKLVALEMTKSKEKGYNRDQLSATAKNANARKCDIYDRLRSGTLLIPKCLNETSTYASRDETSQLFLFLRTAFQCDT